ncbi:hypothetical protein T484DRAFT_1980453 [Baffinella frigidus]|nr:hypothetical protein T484DRAFT_1980453 [Cryptophyta sp. CCMP2293]
MGMPSSSRARAGALCWLCGISALWVGVAGEGYTGEACRVPEPGNELVECDWQTGDPRASRDPWRWNTSEIKIIPPWPPVKGWGGEIQFSNPEKGTLAEAATACKAHGGAVGTWQVVSAYWFQISNFTSSYPDIHPWKPFDIWDGHTGVSGSGKECRVGILAGRSYGRSRAEAACVLPDTRYICARCIEGLFFDPTTEWMSDSPSVVSSFGPMVGKCVSECSAGRVPNAGGCNPA